MRTLSYLQNLVYDGWAPDQSESWLASLLSRYIVHAFVYWRVCMLFLFCRLCAHLKYIYSVIGSKRELARAHTQASISFQQYHIFGLHNRWSELKFSVFVLLYTICSLLCARIFAIQSKFSWWKLCVCISVCLFSFQLAYNFLRNANN